MCGVAPYTSVSLTIKCVERNFEGTIEAYHIKLALNASSFKAANHSHQVSGPPASRQLRINLKPPQQKVT